MQKYYKKFSNNVCVMDPTFLGQKKDLLLNELGATLCKINRKCGEICLFESPTSSGSKKIKIKKKHHHERRPHTSGEINEKMKVKSSKETKSIELAASSRQAAKVERRESSRRAESSHKRRPKHHRLLDEDPDNVKHLYEDSQTEIYFINTSNNRSNRKRKHVPMKHRVDEQLLDDNSVEKYTFAKDKTRRDKDNSDFYKRDSESQPTTKEPFAVSTLSQLSSLFFRSSKHDKPKDERHKKHSKHTVETSDFSSDQKSRPFSRIHQVHHAQVDQKNPMAACSETREKKTSVIKHTDALEDIQEEKNEYRDETKVKHGKGERISIRVSDKSKRRSKRKDANGTEPKSLFQNLHVNFGKCIMLEERKHNSKSSGQKVTSLIGCEDVSSQHDIKEWLRKQQTRMWSKDSLRMIESKRSKSESSLNCKSISQTSALQAKLYKRRNTVSEKAEIIFAKSSQRILRSKSSLPFTVPSEEVSMKLSRDDFVYFIEKLRQSFEDGTVRDVQRSLSLVKKKSVKDPGKIIRKQKLKRLSRTSYFCIFEMSSSNKDISQRSAKSNSRKSKREMVLCKDVVSIENMKPQQVVVGNCAVSNEMPKDSTVHVNGSKDSKGSIKSAHLDEIKVKSSKEVSNSQSMNAEQDVQGNATKHNENENSALHISTVGYSADVEASTEVDYCMREKRRSQLVQTVFNIVNIPPMQGVGGILKQFGKKVSFPETQVEEIVEKKKKTAPFRRYYKYSSNTVECVDNGSQTWTNAFLSDCNIACGFSDVILDDCHENRMPSKLHNSAEIYDNGRRHSESRIPIKVGKSRPSKQNSIRRRDICSCSDTSSHISTSDTGEIVQMKKRGPKVKQEQSSAPTYLISNVACPLEATLKNILEEVANRLEEKPTNNVGVSCSISAGSSPRYSPHRRLGTPGRLRSHPSSIRTDSEAVSVGSAKSRGSWNVIKKPTVINTRSNSAMENRLISKSTLRYSENSLRTLETRNASNQPFAIDEGGKVDGRALIDELVQRLADIKQDLLVPHECNFDDATSEKLRDGKKKSNISRSLSPPKSKLPVHRNAGVRDIERAKSFIEENKHIHARIKNYKMKNNLEQKKTYQVISNRKTGVSKAKIGARTASRTASDTSVTKERTKDTEANSLSVIASKSETNLAVYKEVIRPQYSRVSSRITLENFISPKRHSILEKAMDSRSCSIHRRDRSTNSNMSTLFLTKDYRSTSTMSSYQRRKNYDLYMRRVLKMKTENEAQKYPLSPQVFEVRYLTVTNDTVSKTRVPMVTRGTQNTAEQACQVSCVSDTSGGESYGQIIRCVSLDELPISEMKSCNVCRDDQASVQCEQLKCPRCIRYAGIGTRNNVRKKKKKHKYSIKSQTTDSFREAPPQSNVPSKVPSKTHVTLISPKGTSIFALPSEENLHYLVPKDSVLRSSLKDTPSWYYKKEVEKNLHFELPHSYRINHTTEVGTRKRISTGEEEKTQNWGFSDLAGYLRSALFCCCMHDIDEPPRKKRKCSSKSRRHRAKKNPFDTQSTNTQNFQLQLGRAFDLKFGNSGTNYNVGYNNSDDRKCQDQVKPIRHPDVTEKSFASKLFPVEWFRNISSLVFLEQNVINAPPIFPELTFDLVNTKFDSVEQETFCLIDEKYCLDKEIYLAEEQKNLDQECSSLLTENKSTALHQSLEIQFNRESTPALLKNTPVFPVIRRSMSDITSNIPKMEPGEGNDILLQSAATAVSLSTNYSSCLASSRRTSVHGSVLEMNDITVRSNEDLEENCVEEILLAEDTNIEQPSRGGGDLFEIHKSDGLPISSPRKGPQVFDAKSCENLSSSQESGYTSLVSSKTPSPTSFFKRRSIMELFKFPLERAKSRSSIVDVTTYTMFNDYRARELQSDTSLQTKKITDNLARTCRYNKMNRDCQKYAHKVRMCAEQRHDGVYEGDDNYTEISLDILLGRTTGLSKDKPSRTQFEMRSSNTPSLIILDGSGSEISVVESVTEVYRAGLSSNDRNLLQDIHSSDLGPSVTKASKSEGALEHSFVIYEGNELQITKSDSYVGNDFNKEPLDFNAKRSFERFSTTLSNRMADRDFFQKLIVLYEKENEYAERLLQNHLFFAEQMELVEGRKALDKEKKKPKHIFNSLFRRNKKATSKCQKENLLIYARDNILYAESSNQLSQFSLDGYTTDCSRDDCISLTVGKAYSLEELETIPIEMFQQLAHKVKRHFGPLVKASSSNKFMNDELKLTGFQKLLEKIEEGDIAMLQRNGNCNWEECVRHQVRQYFTIIYEATKEAAKEAFNMKKVKLSDVQVDLIKCCATKYRNNIHHHLKLLAVCIGKEVIKKRDQLNAAVIYLSRLDGNRYVSCEELGAYITREL